MIGEGKNFVRTMASLAERGIDPTVVDDQIGRLTFTGDIARGIRHLLETDALRRLQPHGSGEPQTWADIARHVFELAGHDPPRVSGVSTEEYFSTASTRSRRDLATAFSTSRRSRTQGSLSRIISAASNATSP